MNKPTLPEPKNMPELPDALFHLRFGYDAEQMRDYALQYCASLEAAKEKLRGSCELLSGALSRICYACEPPNEMECSSYDVHFSEDAVVDQVRGKIASLEARCEELRGDAERWGNRLDAIVLNDWKVHPEDEPGRWSVRVRKFPYRTLACDLGVGSAIDAAIVSKEAP